MLHVVVIMRGIRTIRFLQGITAPFLLLIGAALLAWAVVKAERIWTHARRALQILKTFGDFFHFGIPSLTGVVVVFGLRSH